MSIAVAADRTPVVEMVCELPVATDHEVRFESRPGEAVVATGAPTVA